MTEGLAIEPAAPELDAAAKQYLDNLNALKEKVSEAHKYYERENYKDDKFAKGKGMHAPLVAAMTAFEKRAKISPPNSKPKTTKSCARAWKNSKKRATKAPNTGHLRPRWTPKRSPT